MGDTIGRKMLLLFIYLIIFILASVDLGGNGKICHIPY